MPYQAVGSTSRPNGVHNGTHGTAYGNGTRPIGFAEKAAVEEVTTNASGLAHDLITLVELQAKLAYFDVREAGRRSSASLVSLAAMVALLLGSIPIVLLGLAELLVQYAEWSRAASYLTVGGVTIFGGAIVAWLSISALRRVTTVFSHSYQEFQENLEFVKSLVKRG